MMPKLVVALLLLALAASVASPVDVEGHGVAMSAPAEPSSSSSDSETSPLPSPSMPEGRAAARCDRSANYVLNDTAGDFGCSGATNNARVSWTFSNNSARIIKWSITGYTDSYVTFTQDGVSIYGQLTPTRNNVNYFAKGSELTITYFSGSYNQNQYGLLFTVMPGPAMNALVSGQTTIMTQVQQGGFVYFLLPRQSHGRYLQVDVEVFSYTGLQEPSVFMSRDAVPTLEKFDYTNTTFTTAGHEACLVNVVNPPDASYMVGVFLYGQAASMSVKATWSFNVNFLVSGVKVSNSQCGTCFTYYQIFVPSTATKLVFQISRQLPGGYPVAWISQGVVPSALSYQWVADTKTQSYISITIPNPNPPFSTGPNPGEFLFTLGSSDGQTAGYIIQADWA